VIGGGHIPMSDIVSPSHNRVLFLDELPKIHRQGLEVLRQRLEKSIIYITISRTS
jgi:predicted ATPase with chaperone activity